MTDTDAQQYLANIVAIMLLDNIVSPKEEETLEQIRLSMKTRKKDVGVARELVSQKGFEIKPIGRYSDKIRNIEDMLFLAMSDGELSDAEKDAIRRFAKMINLNQDQVNLIVRDTRSRLQVLNQTVLCASCWKKVPVDVKFCPECGQPMVEVEELGTKVEFEYPSEGISIEFAESSAANFHEILASAQQAQDFQEIERRKKKWYLATWPKNRIAETMDVAGGLRALKNRRVLIDGRTESWDDVYCFFWCYQNRIDAYRPVEYCFGVDDKQLNIWGCRLGNLDWHGWRTGWLSYGNFLNEGQFAFDKKRIKHELQINLYKLRFCPAIKPEFVEACLAALPDKVRVGERFGWTYNRSYQETPNTIKLVETVTRGDLKYNTEFYADGVRPVGVLVAQQVLAEALQRCAMPHVNLQNLIGDPVP